jgi:hypothetical protein
VKPEQLELMFPLMVIAMLVWASGELPEPKQEKDVQFPDKKNPRSDSPQQTPINPRQKEWAEKAVRRYAEAQEKNWRNWNEAMFEPD